MAANICNECRVCWPIGDVYKTCPYCLRPTKRTYGEHSDMAYEEARDRRLHAEFEHHYARHEIERERRGDPSPEALGLLKAHEEIEQIRDLEAAVEAK